MPVDELGLVNSVILRAANPLACGWTLKARSKGRPGQMSLCFPSSYAVAMIQIVPVYVLPFLPGRFLMCFAFPVCFRDSLQLTDASGISWTHHSVIFDLPDQPLNIRSKRAGISSRFLLPFSHHHPLPRRILSLFSAVLSSARAGKHRTVLISCWITFVGWIMLWAKHGGQQLQELHDVEFSSLGARSLLLPFFHHQCIW